MYYTALNYMYVCFLFPNLLCFPLSLATPPLSRYPSSLLLLSSLSLPPSLSLLLPPSLSRYPSSLSLPPSSLSLPPSLSLLLSLATPPPLSLATPLSLSLLLLSLATPLSLSLPSLSHYSPSLLLPPPPPLSLNPLPPLSLNPLPPLSPFRAESILKPGNVDALAIQESQNLSIFFATNNSITNELKKHLEEVT